MKHEWKIAFTQYLRPNGQKQVITIGVTKDIAEKAARIAEAGYHLEAEILTTDQVSLTIAGKNTDVGIMIVANGPEVPPAVAELINMFDFDDAKRRDEAAA